ncbi:MAG: aminoglycoside phosphotransferase family protein [Lachnospiraceae bacterium]|nr:aminoglycoside phosphotransferase family protein [Lachnospiraceae bacterium]
MVSRIAENIPKLFEFITENQRYGFIMEKVQGKSLASLMQNDHTFDHAMEIFTNLHKSWLTQAIDGVVSYTEWMLYLLSAKSSDGDLADKIKCLPLGNALCHGDFHPYNIIITSEGVAVTIDFANICKAPKEYDVARTYFLLKEDIKGKSVADLYLAKMKME